MNLGKILVPEALLTKTGDLTEEERAIIRDSILGSADLLEGVAFDGPVVPTIRHIHENWDGSGPEGLEGENIEVGARVVSVANAFAGMTSARAWRGRHAVRSGIQHLECRRPTPSSTAAPSRP